MQSDYEDLEKATTNFRNCCKKLGELLDEERQAEEKWLEKQKEVRLKYWKQVTAGEMTQAMFDKTLKNDCFQEEIDYKKARTIRKQCENNKDSLKEKLYTTKLKIKLI